LSKHDFSALYPEYNVTLKEQIEVFAKEYQWVLSNPASADDTLALRETGKAPPYFREAQPLKPSGNKNRPESEFSRVSRQIANVLGRIQATWNGILNFVIPVSNPRLQFWATLYSNAVNWDITPTNSMYNCIRNEGSLAPLYNLKNAPSKDLLDRIGNIVAAACRVPTETADCIDIVNTFKSVHLKQKLTSTKDPVDDITTNHVLVNLDALKAQPITETETETGKKFLGIRENKSSKQNRRSGASGIRLDSSVINELDLLKNHAIYQQVYTWLSITFKTHDRKVLQLVAAERILGEALKHQDTIFEEELEIQDFEDIEEYYEEH
jgi:hypothetical protein